MSDAESDPTIVYAVIMRLFREQAFTISKSGSNVSVECENGDDANAVFEWLVSINNRYALSD